MSTNEELTSQEFLEQANLKEKTFGHNKFQIEIENYKNELNTLKDELTKKNSEIDKLKTLSDNRLKEYEHLQKTL